jgi:hypothetical protein
MNVAEAFPARREPGGVTWYRAAGHDGVSLDMGWTNDLAQAHPDYRAPGAPQPLDVNPAEINLRWPTNDELAIMNAAVGAKFDQVMAAQPVSASVHTDEPTTTNEEIPAMTCLDSNFDECTPPRWTEWMRYPLPPETPRYNPTRNGWGWYQLPSPSTGIPTGFPRATTIAETLDDSHGLSKWKRRETAARIFQLSQMPANTVINQFHPQLTAGYALNQIDTALTKPKVGALDDVLDVIDNLLGGAHSRELGSCVHAWIEALAMGLVLLRDVPPIVRPHIDAARKVCAHRGIIAVPEYVERIVLNDRGEEETVAGRIDCIWRIVTTGDLVLGDVKTSKSLKYSWMSFGVQVGGVYGWSARVLSADGKSWERMPKLIGVPHPTDHKDDCPVRETVDLFGDDECYQCKSPADPREPFAILLHVPSDQPEHAAAITINQEWSGGAFVESLTVRRMRKEAKVQVPKLAVPVPSKEAIRYVEARNALSAIESANDGEAVYQAYEDVWDDDLGEFAEKISELI